MTDAAIDDAIALQRKLAARVERADRLGPVRRVAGVDVAYAGAGTEAGARLVAAAAVLDAETLAVVEVATAHGLADFPYVPGLFSFRELPSVLAALARLSAPPDLIVCDGQGIAHPRRCGLASHLGVATGLPTIGCAKTRLVGTHDAPGEARGARAALVDAGEEVGAALRTQDGVKPLFVSIGHRVSLATTCDWVLRLTPSFRLPETTRAADQAVRAALRAGGVEG